ncbi:sigma-70 domain-containing protein [Roseburia hominis]
MAGKLEFREKLAGIQSLCKSKNNQIEKSEVEEYFQEDNLSREQMDLVFDYLLSQNIVVKNYIKTGGAVIQAEENEEIALSAEEQQYLSTYEEELRQMKDNPFLKNCLQNVIQIANELHRPEIFLGDMVQEGNVGLMTAMSQENYTEATLLKAARENIQALLESQTETRKKDRRMADRVNDLDQQIQQLTQDLGRKITVDELATHLNITEEEIADILKLAGEDLPPND